MALAPELRHDHDVRVSRDGRGPRSYVDPPRAPVTSRENALASLSRSATIGGSASHQPAFDVGWQIAEHLVASFPMTIPRWLTSLLCSRSVLRPGRALLTPTWLAAIAVLGVNDHLLKGAGVLPGVVTGKLSDIAGMIVAPVLLAALLGLRSRRGLLFCHAAVGVVFAAINVSPAAADAWTWLMSLVGANWVITVDPTDLLTLPALALGWHALVPA